MLHWIEGANMFCGEFVVARNVVRRGFFLEYLMSTVTYPHIELTSDGVPIISGTTTKVVQIVQDHLAHHWHAEDIHREYLYLSLGQIHSALAYYYDHKAELDQDIDRRWRRVVEIRAKYGDDTIPDKLRQSGHLP
jgi:uncharacterized protein (DUF433 family)